MLRAAITEAILDVCDGDRETTAEPEWKNMKVEHTWDAPSFMNGTVGSETVTLLVGPDENPHVVHKTLLCHYAPYFTAALKGSFKERFDNAIRLEDTELDVIGLFTEWLYRQTLPGNFDTRINKLTRGWETIILELYIFGDRYDVPELRRHAMDEFFSLFLEYGPVSKENSPEYVTFIQAFNSLPDTSPLCRFLIDIWALSRYSGDEDKETRARAEIEVIMREVNAEMEETESEKEASEDGFDDEESEAAGSEEEQSEEEDSAEECEEEEEEEQSEDEPELQRCNYHEHKTSEDEESCRLTWQLKDAVAGAAEKGQDRFFGW